MEAVNAAYCAGSRDDSNGKPGRGRPRRGPHHGLVLDAGHFGDGPRCGGRDGNGDLTRVNDSVRAGGLPGGGDLTGAHGISQHPGEGSKGQREHEREYRTGGGQARARRSLRTRSRPPEPDARPLEAERYLAALAHGHSRDRKVYVPTMLGITAVHIGDQGVGLPRAECLRQSNRCCWPRDPRTVAAESRIKAQQVISGEVP